MHTVWTLNFYLMHLIIVIKMGVRISEGRTVCFLVQMRGDHHCLDTDWSQEWSDLREYPCSCHEPCVQSRVTRARASGAIDGVWLCMCIADLALILHSELLWPDSSVYLYSATYRLHGPKFQLAVFGTRQCQVCLCNVYVHWNCCDTGSSGC